MNQTETIDQTGRVGLSLEGDPAELLELLRSFAARLEKRGRRLNHQSAQDIRQRFAQRESVRSIASEYEVTTHTVKNVLKGKTWRAEQR
jgi:DNA invertase Pin-like site-specific DNA recombinase